MSARLYIAGVMMLWSAGALAEGKSLRSQLEGSWKLVSTEQLLTDGTRGPNALYGPGRVEYLVFADDSEGSMCVVVDPSPRTKHGLDAYCGRYQLNEAERYLVYDVVFDAVPNDARAGLKRYISVDGKTLTLRSREPGPGIVEYTLTWRRFSD